MIDFQEFSKTLIRNIRIEESIVNQSSVSKHNMLTSLQLTLD